MIRSPFTQRKPQDFRILMLYPNVQMNSLMPQNIGVFTALLKNVGYKIDLFDCTYYQDFHFDMNKEDLSEEEMKEKNRSQLIYDVDELLKKGGAPKKTNIKDDFVKKIQKCYFDSIT